MNVPFQNSSHPENRKDAIAYFEIPEYVGNEKIPLPEKPFDYQFCKSRLLLPIGKENGTPPVLLMADPFDDEAERHVSFLSDISYEVMYCAKERLLSLIDQSFHQDESKASELLARTSHEEVTDGDDRTENLLDDTSSLPPSMRILYFILKEAIQKKASDIHFEPSEEEVRVRYRLDGVLYPGHILPADHKNHILSRIKIMARLDIAETRRPQDGRIRLLCGKKEIDFRVGTIPVDQGERIVLRILDRNDVSFGLDGIGMDPLSLEIFRTMMGRSEGLILVTGPTGSGKTTTLYGALSDIPKDSLNIMTIEDPVEYKLPGIAQMNVRPKIELSFAKGLRHILRQDPDVIMIGEIRDTETARIAIQAALTGHLVISTLHTNDAPSAINRLIDMGIEPYLLASCIIGIMAQRLVRTLCPHCKIIREPSLADKKILELDDRDRSFHEAEGCERCHRSGYSGRRGIYELMNIKKETRKAISAVTDSHQLRAIAKKEGFIPLKEQGLSLARKGETSLKELIRVIPGSTEQSY